MIYISSDNVRYSACYSDLHSTSLQIISTRLAKTPKPTNAHKCVKVCYIINIVCLLQVSATRVAILKEVRDKGFITKVYKPLHRCLDTNC